MIVILHVENHPMFERDGQDLYCAVPVTFAQAVLGADITIPSLDGKRIELKIPAGTASGKLLRIRGAGVPFTGSPDRKGDLYVKIIVQIPTKISGKQRDLLQQYLELDGATTSPQLLNISSL